jgi:phosphatidylglycerophosphate synthase
MRPTADDARLAAAVKTDDGFFATFFVASYSPRLVRAAARRGLSPNQITAGSLLVGLGAAAAFAVGSRAGLIIGAVLLQVSFTLDVVDGQLARYTATISEFGAWFDGLVDRAKEYAVYAGLAIGSSRDFHHDVWALAGAALIVQTARHSIDFGYAAGRDGVVRSPRRDLGYWARRVVVLPIGERLLLISISTAVFRPEVTLVALVSWGGLATAYTLAGRVRRALAEPAPPDTAGPLTAYRDDGIAGRLASRWPAVPAPRWLGPPLVRVLIATAPWLLALGLLGRHDGWRWSLGATLAWLIAWSLGGPSPDPARLDFLIPSLLLVAESVGVLRLAAIAGDHDVAAGFAVAAAIVMRRYDVVYRKSSGAPTGPVDLLTAGWQVRLVAAYVLAAASAVMPGDYVLAGLLAALLAAAERVAWKDRRNRRGTPGRAAAEELS